MSDLTLTVAELAQALGISRGLAYEAVRLGQVPSIRIGNRILVPRSQLMAMLANKEDGPVATGPSSDHSSPSQNKEGINES